MIRYVGVESDKLPDGWGEMEYHDGGRYRGEGSRGMRDGCGVMVSQGFLSTRYSGAWRQDKQTGKLELLNLLLTKNIRYWRDDLLKWRSLHWPVG